MNTTAETALPTMRGRRKYWRYGPHNVRTGFRRWRRSRPFWGGLLAILGGVIITYGPASAYKVILTAGDTVWIGILVGALISIFGLFLWFQPGMRHFYGVLITVLSVLSFITSDIGGFIIGMLLGITGGSMGFAWVPVDPSKIKPHVWQRRRRREWYERRRAQRLARALAATTAVEAEIPVMGIPVQPATTEVSGMPVEPLVRGEATTGVAQADSAAAATEPTTLEAVGEEVERLPTAEATAAKPPATGQSRWRGWRGRRP